jgi:DNA polymerase
MTGDELTKLETAAVEKAELTSLELKASLNQYLRILKEAGLTTVPKGHGNFDIVLGASGVDSEEVVAQALLSSETVTTTREDNASYISKTGQSSPTASQTMSGPAPIPLKSSSSQRALSGNDSVRNSMGDRSPYPAGLSASHRHLELQQLESTVGGCTKCPELSRCRNRVVFGVGNITPRLVFLGEAPGADEDRQGEPFVGAAGQLLNKIIGACKLSRSDVYILNTIKCRPPGNRNPSLEELENCWAYTQRQLEILRPEFICCLGLIATKRLLNSTLPLGQLRQKFHHYRDSRVVVTYHPAYLLRTESAKKYVWEDMKMLMGEMGIELSS